MTRTTMRRLQILPPVGFTLVELMVVMVIIGLLAATTLVALGGAEERARESRTRAQIAKIDAILSAHWETYQTRRVPVNPQGGETPQQARLAALRELMRMELPDRASDVRDLPMRLSSRPALSRSYETRASSNSSWGTTGRGGNTTYVGAECLYMIMQNLRVDGGTAIEMLTGSEIGDVDNDNMPEILDGWGQPIEFLRWPSGYRSPLQDGATPDPFDPDDVNSTNKGFLLYPLIYSAGADGEYEHYIGAEIQYSSTTPPNDPFATDSGGAVGAPNDFDSDGEDGTLDNITNHEISSRTRP